MEHRTGLDCRFTVIHKLWRAWCCSFGKRRVCGVEEMPVGVGGDRKYGGSGLGYDISM